MFCFITVTQLSRIYKENQLARTKVEDVCLTLHSHNDIPKWFVNRSTMQLDSYFKTSHLNDFLLRVYYILTNYTSRYSGDAVQETW